MAKIKRVIIEYEDGDEITFPTGPYPWVPYYPWTVPYTPPATPDTIPMPGDPTPGTATPDPQPTINWADCKTTEMPL